MVKQLQALSKQNGVSIARTKADFIKLLDELEPGVDHSGLKGKLLIEAKKKHHIGPLKNKQQLIHARLQLAEQAKQEALEAAKKEALNKAKDALEEATAKVVVPESPSGYADFFSAVKDAEAALKATQLKTLAKETQVKHWQWSNKDELVTIFTETESGQGAGGEGRH